jgi:hypothetical protein
MNFFWSGEGGEVKVYQTAGRRGRLAKEFSEKDNLPAMR